MSDQSFKIYHFKPAIEKYDSLLEKAKKYYEEYKKDVEEGGGEAALQQMFKVKFITCTFIVKTKLCKNILRLCQWLITLIF